jgi:alpha-galactosidase
MHDLLCGRNALLALLFLAALRPAATAAEKPTLTLDAVRRASSSVVASEDVPAPAEVKVVRDWSGPLCQARLVNEGKKPVQVKEVILFDIPHAYPAETHLYGEGFTMLSQTTGTIGKPIDMGLTDRKHYRIPQPAGATVVYGLLTLWPGEGEHALLAFTSCRRFIGRFYVRPKSIQVAIDTEGLTLAPGATWKLEELLFRTGSDRNALLTALGEQIARNHPRLPFPEVPTGWCSWYCFGSRVTAKQVLGNLDFIAKNVPALRYIQIDDGYQAAMGDWLEAGRGFDGGVRTVLEQIRKKGGEPAIWVAPFIAEKGSRLFREHPDWFIKDDEGKPLSADRVTFKGWRRGPWFALDGTHPQVQKHFESLFRTLRRDWGCTYFKLDANFWGAMHGGKLHDSAATRIEAYRRGMEAILRGAGDSFILGCNHPIWPSFGLVHGSRSSGDIKRLWTTFSRTARQNLSRNWQNGRLWWNDPDCVVLTGELPEDEYLFHASVLYASGGMLLSGDDLTRISAARLAMLRKLLPAPGVAAEFEGDSLQVGWTRLGKKTVVCLLNWSNAAQTLSFKLPRPCRISDHWTGKSLGRQEGRVSIKEIPRHSARLLVCEPAP